MWWSSEASFRDITVVPSRAWNYTALGLLCVAKGIGQGSQIESGPNFLSSGRH